MSRFKSVVFVLVLLINAFSINAFSINTDALAAAPSASKPVVRKQHGYFISIDGMRPEYLTTLVAEGKLNSKRGLGWLYRNSVFAKKAWPVSTTLTAVSHASTITCSYPSDHGIIANNFLENGAIVSGFNADIKSETLWQAARADGRTVSSFAYVGTDGRTPARQIDYGVAYPDSSLISAAQTFKWKMAELPVAQGWTLSGDLVNRLQSEMRETTVKFVLNPITKEERIVHVLLFADKESSGAPEATSVQAVFSTSKNLETDLQARLKSSPEAGEFGRLYFIEEAPTSTTLGYKRHVFITATERTADGMTVFASRPTYNHAQPASFRKALDAANLVWPDDGWRGDRTAVGPARLVNAYNLHGKFLSDAAVLSKKMKFESDVTLFYQPVIDSVGHSFQSLIPEPFSSTNSDPYTQAMVRAFQNVDANVSTLLEDVGASDVIALMGDHGMDPIKMVANIAALIPEQGTKIRVVTSGSLALIYKTPDSTDAEADTIGKAYATKLGELKLETSPVSGRTFRRSDFNTTDNPWQFGEAVWAFTADTGFYYTFNATIPDVFIPASALGMHGNDNSVATMATGFLFKAPGIRKSEMESMNLIDAAPTFAKHMGFRAPQNCKGKPLDINSIRKMIRKKKGA